jgi:hypothetical protein
MPFTNTTPDKISNNLMENLFHAKPDHSNSSHVLFQEQRKKKDLDKRGIDSPGIMVFIINLDFIAQE